MGGTEDSPRRSENCSYLLVHHTVPAGDRHFPDSFVLSHKPRPLSPASTLHFTVSPLHMLQSHTQSSLLLAPGLKEGKMETKKKKKKNKEMRVPFPRCPVFTTTRHIHTADKLSICRSRLTIHVFDSLIKRSQGQLHTSLQWHNSIRREYASHCTVYRFA